MQVTLAPTQKQVDTMISARLERLCHAEWRAHIGGKRRKTPLTYSSDVTELLNLRQRLYSGESPEGIAATVTSGGIQNSFLKAKTRHPL